MCKATCWEMFNRDKWKSLYKSESYNYLQILDYEKDKVERMNYFDAHYKATKRNAYYTGRINAAINKLKDYQDGKIEYEEIARGMSEKDELKIVKDRKIIGEQIEHKERMFVWEEGICLSEQSIQNLNTFSLAALLIYAITKTEQKSDSAAEEAEENFLKHGEETQERFQRQKRYIFLEEPKVINDLIREGVINPENASYIDFENEEGLELVKMGYNIDSKEGILEFVKNVGKEAGFTKFVIKSSIFVRLPWLMKFFKMDESEVALSVPMEILRSGVVTIHGHILEIPQGFVNEVYKIYQKWPFLAVAMVNAIVCHEEAHRNSKITGLDDKSKAEAEAEASAYLLKKQDLWGVALFTWYFTYYLNTRATVFDCIKGFGFELEEEQFEQIDELVNKIDKEYSKKGGDRAKRYRRKTPSRSAELIIPDGSMETGIFYKKGIGGVTLIPEKVEVVDEKQKPVVMEKFVEDLLVLFNHFHEKYSFERNYARSVYKERTEQLYKLAGRIDPNLDEKTTILVTYILSWGEDSMAGTDAFSSLQEFLDSFNPYLIKYGYYFCLDITKPYRKPFFVGRLNKLEEAYVNIKEEREIFKVVYLETVKISDNLLPLSISYWLPTGPVYLLPASKEVIVFEDLLRIEAEKCVKSIENFKEWSGSLLEEFTFKQWEKIAELPEEEIIERITKDLISSGTIEGIKGAMDFFFIERPQGEKRYEEEEVQDIDEVDYILAQKLAGLALGPVPYYCLGKIVDKAEKAYPDQIYRDIVEFFVREIEGVDVIITDENVDEGIELLKKLDKFTIKEYAEKMYRRKIGGELVRGSLVKLEMEAFLDVLTVEGIISGKSGINSVPVNILEQIFIRTGKVGNDDTAGWDKVVETLQLRDIKPEDVVTKKVEEIIKTEEEWKEITGLYPYLEMVRYEEVRKTTYLSLHWNALKRLSIFNKYEELSINRFKEEENYIKNEIEEYEDLIYVTKDKIDKNEKIKKDQLALIKGAIANEFAEINSKIKSYEEKISTARLEIKELEDKLIVLGKGKKIKEKQTEIKNLKSKIEELRDEEKELIGARSLTETDVENLTVTITKQRKELNKHKEIIAGLELKIEEVKKEDSSLMMGVVAVPVISLCFGLPIEWGLLIGITFVLGMKKLTGKEPVP